MEWKPISELPEKLKKKGRQITIFGAFGIETCGWKSKAWVSALPTHFIDLTPPRQ